MLNIEDVKVGDELVCIDRDGFLTERRNAEYLLHNKMIVSDINEHEVYLRCDNDEKSCRNYIYTHELKYFKKKEQSQYTFDDLIDVAVQARKDKVLPCVEIWCDGLSATYISDVSESADHDALSWAIEKIKSLYKETFVIGCDNDVNKIKNGESVLILKNGKAFKFSELMDIPPSLLPDIVFGATVEQSK